MRSSILSIIFAVAAGVAALPQSVPTTPLAPALPIEQFENKQQFQRARLLTLEDVLAGAHKVNTTETPQEPEFNAFPDDMSISATCSNPRVRQEWDSYSDGDRQAFISAIRCLQNRPSSGQFSQSKTRYEDLVALHQTLTPNIHSQLDRPNAKFLIWHRYYLWAFEDILRSECGFDRNMPWFDETRYAGRFTQSSIFSSRWFGSANVNGNCVTDGQFANLAINVGPWTDNQLHCLSRNNDDSFTAEITSSFVDACNRETSFANMANCAELGPHGLGHNGIGSVMQDVYTSPGDPVFWLHHAFIDRNFRIWQNADRSRVSNIDGTDIAGNKLTLDTTVNVYDMRPTVRIRDLLDTTSNTLCYKYNY